MYLDMVIISLVAAVIGARLYYVGFSWSLYKGNILEIFNTRSGGMGLYGGILGGVLAADVYKRQIPMRTRPSFAGASED